MKLATLRAILMQKPDTTEEVPFGPDVLVFKVKGKMMSDRNRLYTVNFIKKTGRYPHQNIQP